MQTFVLLRSAMGLPLKLSIMLHQISWGEYGTVILLLGLLYYGVTVFHFYRNALKGWLSRLSAGNPPGHVPAGADLGLSVTYVTGKITAEPVDFIRGEELDFGPPEPEAAVLFPEEESAPERSTLDVGLMSEFSDMISETRTLIRVIRESGESRENFEMLFRLLIQKYPALAGTVQAADINNFILHESRSGFPFTLEAEELNTCWSHPLIPQDI